MKHNVDELTERVRVVIDHAKESGELFALDDADALSIDAIIRSKLEPSARQVLLQATPGQIDTAKPLHGGLSWRGEPGVGMALLRLPDDFLRLLSVRLSDWHRPARIITEDDEEYQWQSSRYAVGGTPERPVAAMVRYPEGLCLECYSSRGGAGVTLSRGLYVSEPRTDDDGMLDLPERLVESVVRMAAAMTCLTLGDAQTASVMRQMASALMEPVQAQAQVQVPPVTNTEIPAEQ